MNQAHKKGGYRRHSYDLLDCYKLVLKEGFNCVKFITPKQKKNKCPDRENDAYTLELSSDNSGMHFRVHIREKK